MLMETLRKLASEIALRLASKKKYFWRPRNEQKLPVVVKTSKVPAPYLRHQPFKVFLNQDRVIKFFLGPEFD